jgi:site-specific DNA-methyltransferase (adenine-specific)
MEILKASSHFVKVFNDDVMNLYDQWYTPTVIVSDGPYGIGGFPGDPPTPESLASWYEPHIKMWAKYSTPQTTLWFWGTELSWANMHKSLDEHGWEYKAANIWNKGLQHVAGNSNTTSLQQLPVVTEICVQYVRRPTFHASGKKMTMKEWLRYEWERTGLPLYKANEACNVKNAASRKYLTRDHLWYPPPDEAFGCLVEYANEYGDPNGKPYFSIDGEKPMSIEEWQKQRPKFRCPLGVTNVWNRPPLNGRERIKESNKALHLNQKPVDLMERIIKISSDKGDIVWEPFGGLFSAGVAAHNLKRSYFGAEILPEIYQVGEERLRNHVAIRKLDL